MQTADIVPPVVISLAEHAPSSLWRDALRHMLHKRSAVVGMILLGTLLLVAVFATLFLHERPTPREWAGILLVGAGVLVLGFKR